ncbi:hypothetical protein [Actinomadura sp. SCN-SB]|uniref:hypothetical protein n=1 Tax=Actinomadura sp. SCN-SB TaxID=3373092 RepID=UPI0037536BA3
MNKFESSLRDRHAEAIDARGAAEGELISRIDEGEALAEQLRAVAETRAFAEWWEQLIIHIDQGGDDPYDALLGLRTRRASSCSSARHRGTPARSPWALPSPRSKAHAVSTEKPHP